MDTIGSAEVFRPTNPCLKNFAHTNIGLHLHAHTPFPQGYRIKRSVWLTVSPSFPRTLSIPSLPPACSAPSALLCQPGRTHLNLTSICLSFSQHHTHMQNHTATIHNICVCKEWAGDCTENREILQEEWCLIWLISFIFKGFKKKSQHEHWIKSVFENNF